MNLSNLFAFQHFLLSLHKTIEKLKIKISSSHQFSWLFRLLNKISYVFSSKMSGKVNALLDSGFSQLFLLFHCAVKSEWELGILWRRRKTIHDIRKVEKWNLWPRKCCCLLSCFRVRTLMLRKIQKVRTLETLDFLKLFYTRTGEHWYATSTWLSQWDTSRTIRNSSSKIKFRNQVKLVHSCLQIANTIWPPSQYFTTSHFLFHVFLFI